jgi:sulfur relay (sulfurtransferase) DsrF/TusC family protein
MAKILNIVQTAYRGTLEEQDDTVLWLTHMLKNSGADAAVLLQGNAVNYLARGQDAAGLAFGELALAHPPELERDLEKMIGKGIPVYAVEEDIVDRGLTGADLIAGFQKIRRQALPELLDRHDRVWRW